MARPKCRKLKKKDKLIYVTVHIDGKPKNFSENEFWDFEDYDNVHNPLGLAIIYNKEHPYSKFIKTFRI